ncbi:hypothetical protein [Sphingobacterium cellulitidis]|uniref:hypothetical protein n=1 Tax=Sphingobacterium cellulitidis TaxID=1768011 RepID=UPI001140399C
MNTTLIIIGLVILDVSLICCSRHLDRLIVKSLNKIRNTNDNKEQEAICQPEKHIALFVATIQITTSG